MIVYLLRNTLTGLSYVGSTESPLERRFESHWRSRHDSDSELHQAMQASFPRDWERSVLQEYTDVESMVWGEIDWMHKLGTLHPKIGYNRQVPSAVDIEQRVKRSKRQHEERAKRAPKTRENMTPEEIEQYREHGRRGAAMSTVQGSQSQCLTHEERVANGKLGATALWSRPNAKELYKEKIQPAMMKSRRSWWESLSEEEKERRREMGRQAGKANGGRGRPKRAENNGEGT